MNLNVWVFISVISFWEGFHGFDVNQNRVHRINDFNVGLNKIKTISDHVTTQTYFNAIKETFDIYYRDKKYKDGKGKPLFSLYLTI